jgi:hypothetical protein
MVRYILISLLAAVSACNRHQPEKSPAAPQAAPIAKEAGGASRFGAPLSPRPAVALAAVLAEPEKYDGQDVKLTGQIGAVCQMKGCWLTLASGEPGAASVRVSFKDYAFFVPRDVMGRQGTAEGRFQVKTLSQAEAQHFADDAAKAGAPAKKAAGPERTLALVATGVEIR